jgi:hypothetical protein
MFEHTRCSVGSIAKAFAEVIQKLKRMITLQRVCKAMSALFTLA